MAIRRTLDNKNTKKTIAANLQFAKDNVQKPDSCGKTVNENKTRAFCLCVDLGLFSRLIIAVVLMNYSSKV